MSAPILEAIGVTRVFATPAEDVVAVRDVDVAIRPGEFVALMGPSGCGKSTLLALLSGLDAPTSGDVIFDQRGFGALNAEQRAAVRLREIGMVFQEHQLVPEFTAVENVMLPLEVQGQHHPRALASAVEALARVGLAGLERRYPSELSGGQRQRVGIARAIAGDRRVVIADEATGALDHTNSQMVFRLLHDLAAAGYAVIAATHDMGVDAFATRTLRMIDGELSTSHAAGHPR